MQIPKVAVKVLMVVGGLIAVAVALLIWQFIALQVKPKTDASTTKRSVVVSHVCTDDIVKQASPLMADSQISALSSVVTKIETLSNYHGDVNCDYILTTYYTAIGNVKKAQASVDDMRFAREAGGEYSFAFNPPVPPIEDLQNAIAIQKTLQASTSSDQGDTLNKMDKVK